jgi:hypothetical protein
MIELQEPPELKEPPAGFEAERPSIRLSAYRGDEETWRIDRLRSVRWRLPLRVRENIVELNDGEGTLGVLWDRRPTGNARRAVEEAWQWHWEYVVEHWEERPGWW